MKNDLILLATLATAFMLSLGYANHCAKNKLAKVVFWLSGWILFMFHQQMIFRIMDKYPSWPDGTYFSLMFIEAIFLVFLFNRFFK
ncbi:hypothetical protein [Neisseria yangbaofengii]|uniref:hypothetical protein n=1 Tax=Neisseria yangbaofengii TaxID=2709396 RepID=UPI0013EDA28F|nr:hypothetical protein [Neisseria yangbaofengii]